MPGDDSSETYSGFPGPAYADEDDLGAGDRVKRALAEERMNHTVALPECACLRQPRVVSYADVGDPEGCLVFMMLGMDSHRYMSLLLDGPAKARGVRLLCLDRPGRGGSSDYEDKSANRVLEFPDILRAFCSLKGIESFSLLGQSVGACYALRCAQEMPDMVATTVYLVSPWVPLSVPGSNRALSAAKKLPGWLLKGAMVGMPHVLYSVGGMSLMVKGCSEEESLMFGSDTTAEVMKAVIDAHEPSQGVFLDAMAALEKIQPLGFDYRDVSMPVHVFHGREDHMVPFEAAKWMSEMPACTLSVKIGGTHALLMDAGVMDSVLEFICKDFEHFEGQATGRTLGSAGVRQPFSFPGHTQHFQAEGHLLCREGLLIKGWEERYFLLDGYQLYDLDGPERTTARRVVDIRGAVVRFSKDKDSDRERSKDSRPRIFHFKLVDAKHRVLYDLGTPTAEERVSWTDTHQGVAVLPRSRARRATGHSEQTPPCYEEAGEQAYHRCRYCERKRSRSQTATSLLRQLGAWMAGGARGPSQLRALTVMCSLADGCGGSFFTAYPRNMPTESNEVRRATRPVPRALVSGCDRDSRGEAGGWDGLWHEQETLLPWRCRMP